MTTAHKPTWNPAIGAGNEGSNIHLAPSRQYSARDMRSHTKLKTRKDGQGTKDQVSRRNLKKELEDRERKGKQKRQRHKTPKVALPSLDAEVDELSKEQLGYIAKLDADDDDDLSVHDHESEGSDSDDSDDDEAELMRELEKIKKERAEDALRKEREQSALEEDRKEEKAKVGNPLLHMAQQANFQVKRKWNDDVVFKNQSRTEPEKRKRFINDTIRNDFHRKFLGKYIQ